MIKERRDGKLAKCLCKDMQLPTYVPDNWDWLGLDSKTCAGHYTQDATTIADKAVMSKLPVVDPKDRRTQVLLTKVFLTRIKDVKFKEGEHSFSFWKEGLKIICGPNGF